MVEQGLLYGSFEDRGQGLQDGGAKGLVIALQVVSGALAFCLLSIVEGSTLTGGLSGRLSLRRFLTHSYRF